MTKLLNFLLVTFEPESIYGRGMKMHSQTDDKGQKLPNIDELNELPGMFDFVPKSGSQIE